MQEQEEFARWSLEELVVSSLYGLDRRRLLPYAHLEFAEAIEAFFATTRMRKDTKTKLLQAKDHPQVSEMLEWQQHPGSRLVSINDNDYPQLLKECADAPLVLSIKGNVDILHQSCLSIVGSRHPTQSGKMSAKDFAQSLAEHGYVVCSGLALGVDSLAHQGTLLAKEGKTIAVLGTGIEHIYPKENIGLAQKILDEGGAIISEYSLHAPPLGFQFPRRNRIVAGLSLGTLVVEASTTSGSLHTAYAAISYNREVFAIPGSIHSPVSRGCHKLIREGAKLVETSEHILEELPQRLYPPEVSNEKTILSDAANPQATKPILEKQESDLLYALPFDPCSLDEIHLITKLSLAELSVLLLELEMKGFVASVGSKYQRIQ